MSVAVAANGKVSAGLEGKQVSCRALHFQYALIPTETEVARLDAGVGAIGTGHKDVAALEI